jgi:hypothetical protein
VLELLIILWLAVGAVAVCQTLLALVVAAVGLGQVLG